MNFRKVLPWLPLIGIPLTAMAHMEHGDTGLEDGRVNLFSAIWQAVSITGIALLFCLK